MKAFLERTLLTVVTFVLLESPSPAPIIPPVLDDRSYQDLLTETVSRIPTHNPEWSNFHDSDPGFRLLDFFRLVEPPVLDDLLAEYHTKPFWSGLPFEGETYRGQFAYTWLDAALTSAEDPATVRSPDWLTDHGVNPDWTFNELLAVANVPEPATALLLMSGMMLVLLRARRWQIRH